MARRPSLPRAVLVVGMACLLGAGCARPYSGPKTLAAIGTMLVVGGGAGWVAGERRDQDKLASAGLVTTALGVGAIIAAGGWMALSISCEGDPDCPRNEECREVPAPPGGVPYRQCVRRPTP
jgi:hypothetical protein